MRALLDPDGPDPATAAGLHERYRPPQRSWVRASFVASLDGAATLDGTSGGLGSHGDRAVFAAMRDHADVVLVGAATVRAEDYGAPDPSPERRARRRAAGRAEVPRLAVVGRPARLTGRERWVMAAAAPPLLLTTAAEAREVPGCETVDCGDDVLSLATALDRLAERGLHSVLCEGGPRVLGRLVETGRLDELCLTVSPLLAGPGADRMVTGAGWRGPRRARLTGLLEDDSLLLCRYRLE